MSRPTTIAFYLPQFYPIPENNAWWGEGFTEWRNVMLAAPLFEGHYQPHVPKDFGLYDLRVPEVREAQASAAKAHGIDAFCYYHYWFEGHRPLRAVVDDVLAHGCPDIPFCLAWANENWSRHWDAAEYESILTQRYSAEDDEEHGLFLLRAMSHPLYLRIEGKPILFIYRLNKLPEPTRTLARWRELWRAGGIEDVQIVKFDTHNDEADPGSYGADAAAQFLPHGTHQRLPQIRIPGADAGNTIFDYSDLLHTYLAESQPAWRRYECVAPSWDNTSRRGDGKSLVFHGSTPELYEQWLSAVHRRTPPDGVVLINAWNEWAEGAHLEPDMRHGDAYLKATARALGTEPLEAATDAPVPLANIPFRISDRFAELYLDGLAAQMKIQRRLARLEATMERQVALARARAESEVDELRGYAISLMRENDQLRRQLAGLKVDSATARTGNGRATNGAN